MACSCMTCGAGGKPADKPPPTSGADYTTTSTTLAERVPVNPRVPTAAVPPPAPAPAPPGWPLWAWVLIGLVAVQLATGGKG